MTAGSLRVRLFIAGLGSIALALAASAAGLVLLFERHVERRIDAELQSFLSQLAAGIDHDGTGEISVVRQPGEPRFERPFSGLYWQVTVFPSNNVLRSRSLWDFELDLPAVLAGDSSVHRHRLPGPGGREVYVVYRRLELPPRLAGATVRAAAGVETREIRRAVRAFLSDLVPYLLVIGTLLVAAAWLQVTVGMRPLATVQHRLAAIRSGEAERIGSAFPEEVRPLALEIDALLDARDRQIAKARTRVGDLAHALKTPLQVLAGEAQRLEQRREQELAAVITSLVASMRRLVDRELTRTRLAAGSSNTSADLRAVVDGVIKVARRTPAGERLVWNVSVPAELTPRIDAVDLAEAFGNLVENAARHARSCITVSAREAGELIAVTVEDDGPGIPAEQLDEALRRGGRLDAASPGTGLGLSIVSDIADAWGGRLELDSADPGLKASLRLQRG
jgi:signal transduction histidine kinase